ncbi:MAG: hypothetical protein IPL47_11730 [Phyllobacteriaceae bacterium]|nr:hypothetical protein [Phyllobacteriaceae bacterium]
MPEMLKPAIQFLVMFTVMFGGFRWIARWPAKLAAATALGASVLNFVLHPWFAVLFEGR